MDIKRFMVATALSAVVLVGFEYFLPQQNHKTVEQQAPNATPGLPPVAAGGNTSAAPPVADASQPDPRVAIDADRVHGSLDLRGARLDDLVLKNYHETVKAGSPLVRVLEPRDQAEPNLVEVGWANVSGGHVSVPDANTVWTADHDTLTQAQPVTLSWDNGQGQVFQINIAIDQNYMFAVTQKVINHGGEAVSLYPFSRVERGYTPVETGGYLVHEGPISVIDHKLDESSYKSLRKGAVPPGNIAWTKAGQGGWAGITDKYWLSAVIPQQDSDVAGTYSYQPTGGDKGVYDVGFTARTPLVVAGGGGGGFARP
ncbi:membrane protein insertase YidC, partial [Komagataeibacter saccharivorans]|uniref:membrane protein insertase YidC n=1 Tax=Komagataeibacter saccharivorans TaxID=265959 RepID=UPI0022322529